MSRNKPAVPRRDKFGNEYQPYIGEGVCFAIPLQPKTRSPFICSLLDDQELTQEGLCNGMCGFKERHTSPSVSGKPVDDPDVRRPGPRKERE